MKNGEMREYIRSGQLIEIFVCSELAHRERDGPDRSICVASMSVTEQPIAISNNYHRRCSRPLRPLVIIIRANRLAARRPHLRSGHWLLALATINRTIGGPFTLQTLNGKRSVRPSHDCAAHTSEQNTCNNCVKQTSCIAIL